MRIYMLAIPFMAVASAAHASNWVQVGSSSNGALFVDTESIRTEAQYRIAWSKGIPVSGDVKEFLGLDLYDCHGERTAIRSLIQYKQDGTNETFNWQDYELHWQPVAPDTMGEDAFKLVCK